MENVSKEQAIEDFRNLFGITDQSKSSENEGKFYIFKGDCEREEAIGQLQQYFKDKRISGHAVKVLPLTLVFTTFEIIPIP